MQFSSACFLLLCGAPLIAQSTGATFGEIVRLGGTPSDAVLDESSGRIYLVNQNADRVDVYSYIEKAVVQTYAVGTSPVAAALSPDLRYLHVSNPHAGNDDGVSFMG